MTHLTRDAGESTPLLLGSITVSPPQGAAVHIQVPRRPSSPGQFPPYQLLTLVLPRDSITSTSSYLATSPVSQPVNSLPLRTWRRSCGFIFLQQSLVILELVSLIFYVTLFLYSFDQNVYQRNVNALALVSYILIVMIYSLYSLQMDFPILLKLLGSCVKLFISSLFFAFSLEHIVLLPAFFFYFFPTVAGICLHFLFI